MLYLTGVVECSIFCFNMIADSKTVIVDKTAPEITELKLKTNGAHDTVTQNGVYCK